MRTILRAALFGTTLLALAGCSFSLPGVQAAGAHTPNPREAALRFAQCMRQHGVPDFPDPNSSGQTTIKIEPGSGTPSDLDPSSSAFQSAQRACQKYMPSGGTNGKPDAQAQRKALRFAQCMRDHGITNFPDPKFDNGAIGFQGGGSEGPSGFDPNSPQFQAAQQACASILGLPKPDTNSSGSQGTGTTTSGSR
jgi:hypothetical protein